MCEASQDPGFGELVSLAPGFAITHSGLPSQEKQHRNFKSRCCASDALSISDF